MKKKISILSVASFIFLSLLFFCGKQNSQWKGTIEEEDGMTVVKNPKEPMYSEDVFHLEEELTIGEAEGRKEYMFSLIRDIAVDNQGRIYVLDLKKAQIKLFNRKGDYLKTIGKKGQGPGEMGAPTFMSLTNQDEIMVEDPMNRRLIFYSLEGEFIKNISTAKRLTVQTKVDSKGNFIGIFIDNEKQVYTLGKFDSELNFLHSIGSSPLSNPRVYNPFFARLIWCLNSNDEVIFGYPERYELRIVDPEGELVKKIYKKYDPVEITKEDKEEVIQDMSPANKARKLDIPRYFPAYRGLSCDDEDRIFVQTWEKTEDREGYYYDVFDSEGKYMAKIPLRVRPRVWKKGKLYRIEEDQEGYHMVKRYKVTWKY